eukprot:7242828-Ditylum_brightwellii.AAC.1
MKVSQLKEKLKKHNIKGKGGEFDMREKLEKAMHNMLSVLSVTSLAAQNRDTSMKWIQLAPASAVVEEPQNIFDCRAPTIHEEEAEAGLIHIKHNFDEMFQCRILKECLMLLKDDRKGVQKGSKWGHIKMK